jgi:hypothetical protein
MILEEMWQVLIRHERASSTMIRFHRMIELM